MCHSRAESLDYQQLREPERLADSLEQHLDLSQLFDSNGGADQALATRQSESDNA